MILAISGRIGSGKDTVGQIIQYLTTSEETLRINPVYNQGFEYTMKYSKEKEGFKIHNSNWKIKKFAGKLKQITALLTGCTVENLESQEFKDSNLGPEWTRKLYADLNDDSKFLMAKTSYRWLLQRIGTEAMRNNVHTDVWVNALFADYKSEYTTIFDSQKTDNPLPTQVPTNELAQNPNWIITDMRFPNEFDAVKARDGITIRVNRKGFPIKHSVTGETHLLSREAFIEHPSETALDNHKFDYVIDNNASISDLIDKVKEILIKSKII